MECLTCIATQSTSDTAETIHSSGNLDQSGHFLPARQPRPLAVPTCSQKNKQFITRHPATQPEIHQKYSTSSQPSTQPSTLANQTSRHALNQSKPWANHAACLRLVVGEFVYWARLSWWRSTARRVRVRVRTSDSLGLHRSRYRIGTKLCLFHSMCSNVSLHGFLCPLSKFWQNGSLFCDRTWTSPAADPVCTILQIHILETLWNVCSPTFKLRQCKLIQWHITNGEIICLTGACRFFEANPWYSSMN